MTANYGVIIGHSAPPIRTRATSLSRQACQGRHEAAPTNYLYPAFHCAIELRPAHQHDRTESWELTAVSCLSTTCAAARTSWKLRA